MKIQATDTTIISFTNFFCILKSTAREALTSILTYLFAKMGQIFVSCISTPKHTISQNQV